MSSCDTCGRDTPLDLAVVVLLQSSNTGSKYTECPPCAIERAEDEEHGPKTVSIKPLTPDSSLRLYPRVTAPKYLHGDD